MLKQIASVIALGGAVLGSTIIAMNLGLNVLGYILFLASSIASVYLLMKSKDSPKVLVLQNIFFAGVNILGLVRYS